MTRESFLTFYGKFVRKEILTTTAGAKPSFNFGGNNTTSGGFGAAASSSGAFGFKPTAGAAAFAVGKGEREPDAVAAVPASSLAITPLKFGANAAAGGTSPDKGAADHRARLVAFYEKYNPEKLSTVDSTLKKFAGKEGELFAKLEQKYVKNQPIPPPSGTGPRCYLDISLDGSETSSRLVFTLFADKVPKTAENFRALCTGEKGKSNDFSGTPLCYAGSKFHRIVPGFMAQGGDFTLGDGRGGVSIYGDKFEDESFMAHTKRGLLSMANSVIRGITPRADLCAMLSPSYHPPHSHPPIPSRRIQPCPHPTHLTTQGKNSNKSQFFITLKKAAHLDGKHVVFGELVSDEDNGEPASLRIVPFSDCPSLVIFATSLTSPMSLPRLPQFPTFIPTSTSTSTPTSYVNLRINVHLDPSLGSAGPYRTVWR